LDYGHVAIIDDGIGASWGGGKGGTQYDFDKVNDFQSFVKGGELWNIGSPLFKPADNFNGVSKLSLIRACETAPAVMSYITFTNGQFQFQTIDEGLNANGTITNSKVSSGYGSLLVSDAPAVASTYAAALVTAAAAAIAETRATTGNLAINPTLPTDGVIYHIVVDGAEIATYTKISGDATAAAVATAIRAAITAAVGGFTGAGTSANVVITAPVGSGTSFNTKAASISYTDGSTTIVSSTFANGVAAVAAVKEKRKLTLTNPIVGDAFSTVFGTVSITIPYIAIGTSTIAVLNAIKALCLANGTLAAAYTFAVEPIANVVVLTVEQKTGNTVFALSGSVTHPTPKVKVQLWHGTYKGMDPLNGVPYDGITADNSAPELVAESGYFSTIQQILDWGNTDSRMKVGFITTGSVTDGSGGVIVSGDITSNNSLVAATGGLETYTPAALVAARNKVKQLTNTFFLATKYGANAAGAENDALVAVAKTGSRFQRFVFIGGGADVPEYTSISKPAALHFNAEEAIIVHGDGLNTLSPNNFKRVSSFYKAADVLGRTCGLEVQTPVTWKKVGIDAEFDPLSEDLFEDANDAGVLITYKDNDFGFMIVELGINSLQNNDNLVNEDGTSYSIQVARIKAQLNKELSAFLKKKFFSNQTSGPNRNTVSAQELESATDGFLKDKHASTNKDNYLISHQDIVASVSGTAYAVDYKFRINSEVDFIIPTGTIIDNN
jgi:hypothetical protein